MAIAISLQEIKSYQEKLDKVKSEISKIIVGQEKTLNSLLRGILANGHILVEGVPGIAKTLIIKALAAALGCSWKRNKPCRASLTISPRQRLCVPAGPGLSRPR